MSPKECSVVPWRPHDVGARTELGSMGRILDQTGKKRFHLGSTRFHPGSTPTTRGIQRYDDLLLLDNRWSTQLQGIASGEPPPHR